MMRRTVASRPARAPVWWRSLLLLAVSATMAACRGEQGQTQTGTADGSSRTPAPPSLQQQAWAAVQRGAALVDVRTPAEFAGGHLPRAINIPYDQIAARLPGVVPDTAATVVLYCRTGRRSSIAARRLQSLGYTHVIDGGGLRAMERGRPPAPAERP